MTLFSHLADPSQQVYCLNTLQGYGICPGFPCYVKKKCNACRFFQKTLLKHKPLPPFGGSPGWAAKKNAVSLLKMAHKSYLCTRSRKSRWYKRFAFQKGVISSVGLERCFDRAEVTGSNPVSPTARASAIRDVAQPGRVHVWGACGRRFKSCHPDPTTAQVSGYQVLGFFYLNRGGVCKKVVL